MGQDIFLSYSHLDKQIALELYTRFSASGLTCFLAEKSLHAGDDWILEVRTAIQESEYVLILITPRSMDSKWVYLEVGAAWMEKKKIIPLTLFVDLTNLPELIKNIQARSIETEEEKLSLIYELTGKVGPVSNSIDYIIAQIRLTKIEMAKDRVQPDLVIGVGLGGAVLAGLFSAQIGSLPLKVVDCQFIGNGDDRVTKLDTSSLNKQDISGKNILVIEWARQSGRTFRLIKEKISLMNPASLKSYSLYWIGIKIRPNYFSMQTDILPKNPWLIY